MSVTFKEPDLILADIITRFMNIPAERVVVAVEGYDPPKDQGLYVTIQTDPTEIVGTSQDYDAATDTELSSISAFQRLTVQITSRNRDAINRKEEVVMALTSTYAQQVQELQQCRIFREGPLMNLSFIEGAGALHRYQIPVKITYVKTKTTTNVPVIQPGPAQIQEEA